MVVKDNLYPKSCTYYIASMFVYLFIRIELNLYVCIKVSMQTPSAHMLHYIYILIKSLLCKNDCKSELC